MNVLHLNTSDGGGGAARGAYWLHQALAQRVDSRMLVQRKLSQDDSVLEYGSSLMRRVARRAEQVPLAVYPAAHIFSTATLPRLVHRRVNALRPDIVNIHWINEGFMTPENIQRIRAPVVWTLRDLWPMTGGCHYTRGCERFTGRCGRCPQLTSTRERDLSRVLWHRKRRAWQRNLTFVALSPWIAREAQRSTLLAGHQVVVIPNALDEQRFRPVAREQARALLDLPQQGRYILFSAMNPLEDHRKGFPQLQEAMHLLARRPDAAQLQVLVCGPVYGELPALPLPTRFLGLIDDDERMRLLYAAADVTAMPSLEEAFGKVAMESLACGTPVVCLSGTGTADVVQHLDHGYHARPHDIADLAAGLSFVLDHPAPERLAHQGRAHVLENFTFGRQAEMYLSLYREILEKARSAAGAHVNRSSYNGCAHE